MGCKVCSAAPEFLQSALELSSPGSPGQLHPCGTTRCSPSVSTLVVGALLFIPGGAVEIQPTIPQPDSQLRWITCLKISLKLS